MAIFKISSDKGRYTNSFLDAAFGFDDPADDTLAADSLIVDASAFLVAEGVGSMGAFLNDTGAWNVTVNGTIFSTNHTGIILEFGTKTSSAITVGTDGEVGGIDGILVQNDVTIKNSGLISGTDIGIKIADAGTHTIINNKTGTISGANFSIFDDFDTSDDKVTNAGQLIGAVDLGGGNDTMTSSGTITGAADLGDGTNSFINSGTITGSLFGGTGNDTFSNSKIVDLSVSLGDGKNSLKNTGIIGRVVSGGSGDDTITNSGVIGGSLGSSASVVLDEGNNTLTNSGTIEGVGGITAGSGNDVVTNSKTIFGPVQLGDGVNKLTNSGTIDGGITGGGGTNTITNSKSIGASVEFFSGGINTLTNSGTIDGDLVGASDVDTFTNSGFIDGAVSLDAGDDKLTNSGTINSNVFGSTGNDTFKNSGAVSGIINLGNDNDTFIGGAKIETVLDGNGADNYALGGGNDVYRATGHTGTDGTDIVDGGTGIDTYDVSDASGPTSKITINLDSVAHAIPEFGFATVAKNIATGTAIGGTDSIKNFENATGNEIGDTLYGSAAANNLVGDLGGDSIAGFGGNDFIDGGGDNDNISGGSGADSLIGGGGADNFLYAALNESGVSKTKRDTIFDFGVGGTDTIWLNPIDANTKNGSATNDSFSWIGTNVNFSGAAGELRAYWTASGQIIEGDVNGDKKADFSIEIFDPTHAITLMATDFNL